MCSILIDDQMGSCWAWIDDESECSDRIGKNLMSSAECCGTLGLAWSVDGVCTECSKSDIKSYDAICIFKMFIYYHDSEHTHLNNLKRTTQFRVFKMFNIMIQ